MARTATGQIWGLSKPGVDQDSDENGPFGLKPFHINVSNSEITAKAAALKF
jgi:hypothetical protein